MVVSLLAPQNGLGGDQRRTTLADVSEAEALKLWG